MKEELKSVLYYPDGRSEQVKPQNREDFNLKELQFILGGYIEVLLLKGDRYMIVNEEGKLNGLEINPEATKIVLENGYLDTIAGNALVCPTDYLK